MQTIIAIRLRNTFFRLEFTGYLSILEKLLKNNNNSYKTCCYVQSVIYWDIFMYRHVETSICLFGVLRRFQHCTGHITTGSWKGRGNQNIQFVKVLYCKLPTNGKQLPAFLLEAMPGTKPWPQRWEARVLKQAYQWMFAVIVLVMKPIHTMWKFERQKEF